MTISLAKLAQTLEQGVEGIKTRVHVNEILIPCPCPVFEGLRITVHHDQFEIEWSRHFHTHIYGCPSEGDTATLDSERNRISELLELLEEIISEKVVLYIDTKNGELTDGGGICSVNDAVEYDEEEDWWPHGRPTDRRFLWSREIL
jgi:hypothetical protein